MPFVGDMPYMMGCTCDQCMKVKSSLESFYASMAELSVKAQQASETFKSWQIVKPSLYPTYTYNQYQVVDPKEFYKQLVTTTFDPPPVWEDKPSQEEVNAKWRPWFDNLNTVQRKILSENFPSTLPLSGEFPTAMSENWWMAVKSHLDNPYNHVMYMISQMPVFSTEVAVPCDGECECITRSTLYSTVIHMNDLHAWSFSQIADWLDTLGLDLSFPIPEGITEH